MGPVLLFSSGLGLSQSKPLVQMSICLSGDAASGAWLPPPSQGRGRGGRGPGPPGVNAELCPGGP